MSEAICSLIDHRQQTEAIRRAFANTGNNRNVFWYEAHCEDWPHMLGLHLLFEPWPEDPVGKPRFFSGRMPDYDPEKILDGWQAHLPPTHSTTDTGKRRTLCEWLNLAPLTVFYTQVMPEYCKHLPDYLRGAHEALACLEGLNANVRVIVLFACTSSGRSPWLPSLLWRLYHRRRAKKFSRAHALPAMRLLRKEDISDWHMDFPDELQKKYDHGRLTSEIFDQVFRQRDDPVRFHKVRQHLMGQNGIVRARKR